MGPSGARQRQISDSKNWTLILATLIPIWGVVMFIGWFVISALVPMMDHSQVNQTANDTPTKAILEFDTAAGGIKPEVKK